MDEQRIKEVFSDEAFVKGLFELETPAEVQAALKGKGVEMTESEIIELRDALVKLQDKVGENGELSVEQLDEVAGGEPITIALAICGAAFVSLLGGAVGMLSKSKW